MAVGTVWVLVDVEDRDAVTDHSPIAAGVMLRPSHYHVGIVRSLLDPVLEQRALGACSDRQHPRAHAHHEKRTSKRHIFIARIRRPCAINHWALILMKRPRRV